MIDNTEIKKKFFTVIYRMAIDVHNFLGRILPLFPKRTISGFVIVELETVDSFTL